MKKEDRYVVLPDWRRKEERYLGLPAWQFDTLVLSLIGGIAAAAFLWFGGLGTVKDYLGSRPGKGGTAVLERTSTPAPATAAPPAAPPSPPPTPAPPPTYQEAADMAVLTLQDMSQGWTAHPAQPEDQQDYAFSPRCRIFNLDKDPNELASARSKDLVGPSDQHVTSDATVYASALVAARTVNAYTSAVSDCRSELEASIAAAFKAGAAAAGGQATDVQFTVQDLPFPASGDATVAYRITGRAVVAGSSFEMTLDSVVIRGGSLIGSLTYEVLAGEPSLADEQGLAQTVAMKLTLANDALGR